MATIQDQISTARNAGYSDDDIATKLATLPGYADKIKTASDAGYSSKDIVAHLSGVATSTPAPFGHYGQATAAEQDLAQRTRSYYEGAGNPAALTSASGGRILSAVDQANKENGKGLLGLGEAAANLVSGIGASAVGGWRALAALATGQGLDEAKRVNAQSLEYVYQPKTGVAKLASELVALPFSAAKDVTRDAGGAVGQMVGGDAGRKQGEKWGEIAPDVAGTLLGARGAFKGRSPVRDRATTVDPGVKSVPIDYDTPAYIRNGTRPAPDRPAPVVETAPAPDPYALPVDVPPASPAAAAAAAAPLSPLEAFAAKATDSPYGELVEPLPPANPIGAPSALDEFAARAPEFQRQAVPLNQFDDMLREAPPAAAPLRSPLEKMIAGEPIDPAIQNTVAQLRNTDDISATLKSFGLDDAGAPTVPILPETPAIAPPDLAALPLRMRGPGSLPLAAVESTPFMPSSSTIAAPRMRGPGSQPLGRPRMDIPGQAVRQPMAGPRRLGATTPGADESIAPPVINEINATARMRRLATLEAVGIDDPRKSAIEGDAAKASEQYQASKFTTQDVGRHWTDKFNSEREALANHVRTIIADTKAVSGLDEQSMQVKGQDIAAPYDAARAYFEQAKTKLYDMANQKAAETGLPVNTTSLDSLLNDKGFNATILAKNQQNLLTALRSQLDEFKSLDPKGLSVENAEGFRKWMNEVWSPESSKALGQVKAALDADVFKSAGEDIYAAGRQMHQLEKSTLDDPKGISKLMDADPYSPVNRTTPYQKIPDSIINLSVEQFKHIIDTYNALPAELQPVAQRAIATIKAHYGDKLLSAGSETAAGNAREMWNSGGVNTIMKNNSAKLPMVFTTPEEMQRITNLVDAGNILHVRTSYPGAAAQAANAAQGGLLPALLGSGSIPASTSISGAVAGKVAGAVGGVVGKFGGAIVGKHMAERQALERAKAEIVNDIIAYKAAQGAQP